MLILHPSINKSQLSAPLNPQLTLASPSLKAEAAVLNIEAPSPDCVTPAPAAECKTEIPPKAEEFKDPRLEQVLRLAERGFRLFPLAPHSKKPMKDFGWKEQATNDQLQLLAWFEKFPECNWGMATGPESNTFVLDVDGEEGRNSLNSLVNQGCALPQTLITRTGEPLGCHFWFEHPGNEMVVRNSAGKLGAGLDIRGEGGYVVIPPSVHPNGTTYSFDDEGAEIRSAPEWLLGLIAHDFGAEGLHQSETDPQGRVIPVGERNDTLFRDACAMRRRGATGGK